MEKQMKRLMGRDGDRGTRRIFHRFSLSPYLRVSIAFLLCIIHVPLLAQTPRRSGAHSTTSRDAFTPADRRLIERAIGATCAERIRDPFGSMPIDEMQSRPSLAVNNPDAVTGARRAERLLPTTRRLAVNAIIELAKQYDLYGNTAARTRVSSATWSGSWLFASTSTRLRVGNRCRAALRARSNTTVWMMTLRTTITCRRVRRFARCSRWMCHLRANWPVSRALRCPLPLGEGWVRA